MPSFFDFSSAMRADQRLDLLLLRRSAAGG